MSALALAPGGVGASEHARPETSCGLQAAEPLRGSPSELTLTGVLGQCPAIRELYQLISDLSGSVASVVIQGETGTGKEIIARALHANSPLQNGPFLAVSCAAMPAGLIESELFGHARGAFTDAKTARKGLFVEATGGTLFLDELGELPLGVQPKLLRALQERVVRPLGGHGEVPFDCRVIAATHRDLDVEVRNERFREDLYYRLNVVRLTVPPLRERGHDILLLARHFVTRFAGKSRPRATLAPCATDKLLAYHWPGNVRELENCIERTVALSRSDELTVEGLAETFRIPEIGGEPPSLEEGVLSLVELERRHILRVVRLLGGNKARAADLLGIDRSTLYRRLERYGATTSI